MSKKKQIDELAELVGTAFAEIESEAKILSYKLLFRNYDKPLNQWESFQRAQTSEFRKIMKNLLDKKLPIIKSAIEKAVVLNFKLSQGKLNIVTELESLKKNKIVSVNVPKIVIDRVNNFNDFLQKTTTSLGQQIINDHIIQIGRIKSFQLITEPKYVGLYQTIKKATEDGINQQERVLMESGKRYSFKAFTEMSVRTALQNDVSTIQEQVGQVTGVSFYLASSHRDSADDHNEYQGKYYYDEKWRSFTKPEFHKDIETFIKRNNLKSYQWVKSKPVYFTTRPNCRHYFVPVSVEQVLELAPDQLSKKLNIQKGEYKKEYYDASQKQRAIERNIRKWKDQQNLHEEALKVVKTENERKDLQNSINRDTIYIRKWQQEVRTLVNKYPNVLFRDYQRENNNVVIQDLGVKYDLKQQTTSNL
jgi:hypothetical protein